MRTEEIMLAIAGVNAFGVALAIVLARFLARRVD